jgi:hypothetical protein
MILFTGDHTQVKFFQSTYAGKEVIITIEVVLWGTSNEAHKRVLSFLTLL